MAATYCKAPKTRAEYLQERRASAAGNFVCEFCKEAAYRKPSGTNPGPNRFCSMACRMAAALQVRIEKAKQADMIREAKRAARRASGPPVVKLCSCCGAPFKPVSNGGRPSPYCSEACRQRVSRAQKKTYKIRRKKVRKAATVETVDPIKVFERDKWTCKLCGRKTPRRLRGTWEPNAPEVDHIEPLSLGGSHSYVNTQCACRQCNSEKSNRPRGQMLLIG